MWGGGGTSITIVEVDFFLRRCLVGFAKICFSNPCPAVIGRAGHREVFNSLKQTGYLCSKKKQKKKQRSKCFSCLKDFLARAKAFDIIFLFSGGRLLATLTLGPIKPFVEGTTSRERVSSGWSIIKVLAE